MEYAQESANIFPFIINYFHVYFLVKWLPCIEDVAEQWRIIEYNHEGFGDSAESKAMAGHFGRDKTCSVIASKVFFPNIREMVCDWVSKCIPCQRVKAGSKFDKGGDLLQSIPVPYECWTQIGIDLITNLPVTEEGYNTLITAIDYTSKWVESKPLKGKHAKGVAMFLYELVCRHGACKVTISDQGGEFVSHVNTAFMNLTGISHIITSAYHPQANGEVERFNRTTQETFLKTQQFHDTVMEKKDTEFSSPTGSRNSTPLA